MISITEKGDTRLCPLFSRWFVHYETDKKQAGYHIGCRPELFPVTASRLTTTAFRSFERVDLDVFDLDFNFTMGCKVTQTR